MKAIRVHEFGHPDVMKLEDVPDPVVGAGQVVVHVAAVGVNPVETYIRSGAYAVLLDLPFVPGSDAAGTIEAVGEGVTGVGVGDRVFTDYSVRAAYAQRIVCDPAQVHALPPNIDYKQGAAIGIPYGTAYQALHHRGQAQPGETLLVHGASGAVGLAGVQLGVAAGMKVIGTAGTDRGAQLVRDQGAHHVLNHHEDGYLDDLKDLTGGAGVDVILEMLSNVNLDRDLTALAIHGRVVVIGCRGRIEINPRDTMMRDADIRGMALPNASPNQVAAMHAALGAGLINGSLKPVVGRELALADAPRAHEAVMEPGAYGKIVLLP